MERFLNEVQEFVQRCLDGQNSSNVTVIMHESYIDPDVFEDDVLIRHLASKGYNIRTRSRHALNSIVDTTIEDAKHKVKDMFCDMFGVQHTIDNEELINKFKQVFGVMATYKVRFYKDIVVEDVTNENIAVMIASGSDEGKMIPQDFSVETTLITE